MPPDVAVNGRFSFIRLFELLPQDTQRVEYAYHSNSGVSEDSSPYVCKAYKTEKDHEQLYEKCYDDVLHCDAVGALGDADRLRYRFYR